MVPKYVVQIWRQPQPGKTFELVDKTIEGAKTSGGSRTVTMSLFSPNINIISSSGYESMGDVETMVEGFLADEERKRIFDANAALSRNTSIRIARVIEAPEGMIGAKYVRRLVVRHSSAGRQKLIGAAQEMNRNEKGSKFGILASMNSNSVQLSQWMTSLSSIEESNDALQSDPGVIARVSAVFSAAESDWGQGIGRVMYQGT